MIASIPGVERTIDIWNYVFKVENIWSYLAGNAIIFGAISFLLSTYFKNKIESRVRLQTEQKLEEYKASMRSSEERLKASIKENSDILNALRSGALSNISARQLSLSQRKIKAIENLWGIVVAQQNFKGLCQYRITVNLEHISDEIRNKTIDGKSLESFLDTLIQACGLKDYKPNNNDEVERPFLTPQVWALYSIRKSIFMYVFAQFITARHGINEGLLQDQKNLLSNIKDILSHQAEFIDKYGTDSLPHLVDDIERNLLLQISSELDGSEADTITLIQAMKVIRSASSINELPGIDIDAKFKSNPESGK